MDLDSLEVLRLIPAAGSFSVVAQRLGITQQAVSARVAALERTVGKVLVARSSSGSQLTQVGRALLELAAPVLEATDRLEVGVEALRLPDGALTVAASQTNAELLLPDWLLRLRKSRPDLSVRMLAGNSANVIDLVRCGAADIGFIEGPDTPADLRAMPVASDHLTVVVAPGHPWSQQPSVSALDLSETGLLVREEGSGTRAVLEEWLSQYGLSLHEPVAVFDTTAVIRASARSGVAPAVMSVRSVEADVDAGTLVRVPVSGPAITRSFTAIWARELSAPAHALLSALAEAR
jgi:DNA-binding transcriptional LysR family regulator